MCSFLVPLDAVTGASADFGSRPRAWVVAVIVVMAPSTGAGVYAGKRSPQRTGAGLREGTIALRAFTDRDPENNGR